MMKELLEHIDEIAWDDNCDASSKLLSIQSLLYQYEMIQDAHSMRVEEEYKQMAENIMRQS